MVLGDVTRQATTWMRLGKSPGPCMWARGFMRIERARGRWRCWDVLQGVRSIHPTTVHATLTRAKTHGDSVVDDELIRTRGAEVSALNAQHELSALNAPRKLSALNARDKPRAIKRDLAVQPSVRLAQLRARERGPLSAAHSSRLTESFSLRGLDLEYLLRGALLEQMAAVLVKPTAHALELAA